MNSVPLTIEISVSEKGSLIPGMNSATPYFLPHSTSVRLCCEGGARSEAVINSELEKLEEL